MIDEMIVVEMPKEYWETVNKAIDIALNKKELTEEDVWAIWHKSKSLMDFATKIRNW